MSSASLIAPANASGEICRLKPEDAWYSLLYHLTLRKVDEPHEALIEAIRYVYNYSVTDKYLDAIRTFRDDIESTIEEGVLTEDGLSCLIQLRKLLDPLLNRIGLAER